MRFALLALASISLLPAQKVDPIQWTAEGAGDYIRLTAKAESPWHVYSMTTPRPPIATTAKLADGSAVEVYQPDPIRKMDPNFGVETETFEGEIVFYLKTKPAGQTIQVRYQACTEKLCLPPRKKDVVVTGAGSALAALPAGYSAVGKPAAAASSTAAPAAPVPPAAKEGLGSFLLIAFGFGLAALFTPCVFPMIPITMSFFLGQSEGRSRAQQLTQALIFCAGIVVLFTLMGFALTALLGPFGVVQIASNPWVNAFIAAIFIALAMSMFGAFEITLPSGLLTKLNNASGSGGAAGTLLMGLTFSLTSFACVGPFVGTLLAASVTGDRLQPAMGMLAFSSGLALPFFFLALFPSVLKKMPRAGAWMMRVKVVMGFIILAAALKYVANIDQVLQWNFLTRERFIAAWFVFFTLPGLYLLGLLPMEGIKRDENVGIGRLLTGAAFVVFAISLLPGMFGGKLGELDAYVPLPAEGQFTAGGGAGSPGLAWRKNDLAGAIAQARAEGKLIFVNFTGYACTNCHWMKANMFPRPEIREAMSRFVLVELYTDGTDAASEQNQKYQEEKFQTVAIPLYAILDPDEKVVAVFPGLTKNPAEYLAFLNTGGAPLNAERMGLGPVGVGRQFVELARR
jgi:thiol:disulfide interchange protein